MIVASLHVRRYGTVLIQYGMAQIHNRLQVCLILCDQYLHVIYLLRSWLARTRRALAGVAAGRRWQPSRKLFKVSKT